MTALRLIAVAVIFAIAAAAWVVLGESVALRTTRTDTDLKEAVGGLWGRPQTQQAPVFSYTAVDGTGSRRALALDGSDLAADFQLDQRRKGLLWYATYLVRFEGAYRVSNPTDREVLGTMRLRFPDADGVYDGFGVTVDGAEVPTEVQGDSAQATFRLGPRDSAIVSAGYRAGGLDEWRYAPASDGVEAVEDFSLVMTTDFEEVDFPDGAVSPTRKERTEGGWELAWDYASLISGRPIALTMPQPLNPGPVASRVALFAPVSLLFFFAALVLLTATRDVRLHPMHYAFLAAGFFAFDLLFAYLADRVDLTVAFVASAAVSVALCVGYLRLVIGTGRALVEIAVSQLVFLVLFSYTFFFEGLTGLAVAIGSVITLGCFMAKTAHVDWEQVFSRPATPPPAPPDYPRDAVPPAAQPAP